FDGEQFGASILPGTGRGTIRRMVEGHRRLVLPFRPYACRGCPSTTLRVVPLPRWGRNVIRPFRHLAQRRQRAKPLEQVARRYRPDVPYAEPEQQPRSVGPALRLDRCQQVVHRLVLPALATDQIGAMAT